MRAKTPLPNFDRQAGDSGPGKKWSGLQFSMALSYIGVTVITVLLLEILGGVASTMMLTNTSFIDSDTVREARQKAQVYALEAAVRASGAALPADLTFQPGQRSSITLSVEGSSGEETPYITQDLATPQQVALLITPDAQVLASSYPARYPLATSATQLLPQQSSLLHTALSGTAANTIIATAQGRFMCAAAPIWSKERALLGAAYVQIPLDKHSGAILLYFARGWLATGIILPIALAPIGAIFGLLTTRKLVSRIHHLVRATASMADGDYTQRIPASQRDEVGQLEQQFNIMAQRLEASIAAQNALTEQNARLEERARIARDLHDSIKQQVFAISMQLAAARSLFEQKRDVAKQHLLEADNLAYEVRQELTSLIQELRPRLFREKDFPTALRKYVSRWSRQNAIAIELILSDSCVDLPFALTNALTLIVQEALSNVARHGKASKVTLTLKDEQGLVKLAIVDNGCGFALDEAKVTGVGLQSMQERMAELGGGIVIQSQPGAGTHILAQCPMKSQ